MGFLVTGVEPGSIAEEIGIQPGDTITAMGGEPLLDYIDYLFFSHMDFDHAGGLRLVKDAKQIMAAKEEIADRKILFPLCEKHLGLYQYRTVCI